MRSGFLQRMMNTLQEAERHIRERGIQLSDVCRGGPPPPLCLRGGVACALRLSAAAKRTSARDSHPRSLRRLPLSALSGRGMARQWLATSASGRAGRGAAPPSRSRSQETAHQEGRPVAGTERPVGSAVGREDGGIGPHLQRFCPVRVPSPETLPAARGTTFRPVPEAGVGAIYCQPEGYRPW